MAKDISRGKIKLFNKFINVIKDMGLRDFLIRIAIIIVVILATSNLAFSQIHIATITKIFTRIIGLVMFAFILFGLVSMFAMVRINNTRGSILRAILSIFITLIFGIIYIKILTNNVAEQASVTYEIIKKSYIMGMIVNIGNVIAIILLIIGEFFHGK